MENQLRKIELKQDRNYLFMICLLGIISNYIVFSSNGFLMPVKTDYEFKNNMYFNYINNSEVKFWMLSDIIGFETENYIIRFSLGDVLIIMGLIFWAIVQIKMVRRYKNEIKNK